MSEWRFVICSGCGADSDRLAEVIGAVCPKIDIARAECLSVCTDPVTLAAQGTGRATYVFSGLGPGDGGDIAAFARAYEAAAAGWIEDARPLGRLRFKLVTRVPAIEPP